MELSVVPSHFLTFEYEWNCDADFFFINGFYPENINSEPVTLSTVLLV